MPHAVGCHVRSRYCTVWSLQQIITRHHNNFLRFQHHRTFVLAVCKKHAKDCNIYKTHMQHHRTFLIAVRKMLHVRNKSPLFTINHQEKNHGQHLQNGHNI